MEKTLFTTGQFAKLCKTTKETLRHYSNIGLLKPETTTENGYKYYSFGQMFQFNYIETLKDAGCSLSVIKDSIDSKNSKDFKEILLDQLDSIMIEKKKIEMREKAIRESIKRYDCINNYNEVNTFYIKEDKEQYFIAVPIADMNDYKGFGDTLDDHFTYCEENNIDIPYQFSYITLNSASQDEKEYFGSIVDHKINRDRLLIKPAGRYLKYIQKGSYEYEELYNMLRKYASQNNIKLSSDIYESEINVYGGPKEDYITEISIQII